MTQPAHSRQIRELETQLGLKLFERAGRGMHPMGEGEEFLQHGRSLLDHAEDLVKHARIPAHGEAGVLRVGTTSRTIESLLAPFVRSYQESYKTVRVRLVEGGGTDQLDFSQHGKAYLAITAVTGDPSLFMTRPLGDVSIVVASGSRLRLETSRSKRLEIAALKNVPLLLLSEGFASRELFEAACRLSDTRPNIYMESAAPNTLLALAEAELGADILPSKVRLRGRQLRVPPLMHDGEPLRLPFGIIWRRQRRLPRYAEAFVEQLTDFSRSLGRSLAAGTL